MLETVVSYLVPVVQIVSIIAFILLVGILFQLFKIFRNVAFVTDRVRLLMDIKGWLNFAKIFRDKKKKK